MRNFLSIATGGIFHYKHYVRHLIEDESLKKIYFSHKLSTLKDLPAERRCNIFAKEYLMYAHIWLLGARSAFRKMQHYNNIWENLSDRLYTPTDANLVLLQGNCTKILKKCRKAGHLTIGEAVNIHPKSMYTLLTEDAKQHGGDFFWSKEVLNNKLHELDYLDAILAPSRTVAHSYIQQGFPEERILVIPYGCLGRTSVITPKTKRRARQTDTRIKLLCVAQVFPRKGQFHLLRAIKDQAATDIDVTFIGIADEHYLKSMKGLGVPFNHIPSLPHADVLTKMSDADVVILNSIEDGFGMVVSEALTTGTPVAVSKFAGAAELVASVGGGRCHDPFDYAEVIDSIRQCASGNTPLRSAELPSWQDYARTLTTSLSGLILPQQNNR